MKRILAALVLFSIAAAIVTCFGSRPCDVERIMATKEYKAEQAAHLAKWEEK
jgi:hypothetical protein